MTERGHTPAPSAALRDRGLKPRKRLGQNFLRDRSYLPKIIDAADIQPDDSVVEIGAGTGVLTRALVQTGVRVLAIELDDSLYALLTEEFADELRLRVWHGNALDFDPCAHSPGPYKLLGNIPYYITGPIVRRFLEAECKPELLVLMVQREVAERMTAGKGDLSLLGVSVQFYATPSIVATVPAEAFYPRPRVDSAIVKLALHQSAPDAAMARRFFIVARAGFGTRRKQLGNALAHGLKVPRDAALALLQAAEIDSRRRAEDLTIEEWVRLARHLPDETE
jgi:16S rRNA (adenine1518-N6/adenine1519-N6)-dimethyltransferase